MAGPFVKNEVVFDHPSGQSAVMSEESLSRPEVQKYLRDNGFTRRGVQAGVNNPSAGTTSTVTGRTVPSNADRFVSGPATQTWVNKSGHEVPVIAQHEDVIPGILPGLSSESPGPGYERKNGPGVAALMATGQGASFGTADDAIAGILGPVSYLTGPKGETYDAAQNRATSWTEKWFEDHARENPQVAPLQLAGSVVAPNPLSVLRPFLGPAAQMPATAAAGASPLAKATAAVGGSWLGRPLNAALRKVNVPTQFPTKLGEKVAPYLEGVTGTGLTEVPNRLGAMGVVATRGGAATAAQTLGDQPIGDKNLTDAVTSGSTGALASGVLQVLPIPGTTGFGRLAQSPNAARVHPDPRNPFAASEPLASPVGTQWLNPVNHPDYVASLLNPQSLREAGGAARIASLGSTPGVVQTVMDARPNLGQNAAALGDAANSYKIPKSFLPPNELSPWSPASWAQAAREKWPWMKSILGTGEVPLLPPTSTNVRADGVYRRAVAGANERIGAADSAVPPVDINSAFRAVQGGLDEATALHGVPASDLGRLREKILPDSRSKFPTEVETRAVTVHGDAGGYPAVPGVASYDELVAAGYSPVQAREMLFGTEARGAPIKSFPTEVPPRTVPLAGTPGGYLRPGETVPVPVPEAAKWTTGPQVNVGPGAGARPGSRPGTATQTAHRNANPDTVPQELPPTYVQPGPPLGTIERPGYTTYVNAPNANPPPRTVLAPFPAPAPVPAGEVRQKLGGTLRREADYRGLEKVASNEAMAAASGQSALGRFLDDHWQANLAPEELAAAREAKDLATMAHAGSDLTNPNRGISNAPRGLSGDLSGAAGGVVGASLFQSPGAAIVARNAMRTLDRQSLIFPKRAGFNTRLAEALEGNGIDTKWQLGGKVLRGVRELPVRTNNALVADGLSDSENMSIDPNAGPMNRALQLFLEGGKQVIKKNSAPK